MNKFNTFINFISDYGAVEYFTLNNLPPLLLNKVGILSEKHKTLCTYMHTHKARERGLMLLYLRHTIIEVISAAWTTMRAHMRATYTTLASPLHLCVF